MSFWNLVILVILLGGVYPAAGCKVRHLGNLGHLGPLAQHAPVILLARPRDCYYCSSLTRTTVL